MHLRTGATPRWPWDNQNDPVISTPSCSHHRAVRVAAAPSRGDAAGPCWPSTTAAHTWPAWLRSGSGVPGPGVCAASVTSAGPLRGHEVGARPARSRGGEFRGATARSARHRGPGPPFSAVPGGAGDGQVGVRQARHGDVPVPGVVAAHLVVVEATTPQASTAEAARQEVCGWNSAPPYASGYTMEEGTEPGRFPGHAWTSWQLPLPAEYRIEGPGGWQFWKNEQGLAKFLVDSWPGMYRMTWYVNCVDPIPPRHG